MIEKQDACRSSAPAFPATAEPACSSGDRGSPEECPPRSVALADGPSSLSETDSTYLRLGKVVGKRIRLIRGSVRLLGARQPYLTSRKAWRRQDRLLCQKTSLTAEKLGLSTTRQAYPQPANVSGRLDKLIDGKTTLSAFRTKLSAAGERYQEPG